MSDNLHKVTLVRDVKDHAEKMSLFVLFLIPTITKRKDTQDMKVLQSILQ